MELKKKIWVFVIGFLGLFLIMFMALNTSLSLSADLTKDKVYEIRIWSPQIISEIHPYLEQELKEAEKSGLPIISQPDKEDWESYWREFKKLNFEDATIVVQYVTHTNFVPNVVGITYIGKIKENFFVAHDSVSIPFYTYIKGHNIDIHKIEGKNGDKEAIITLYTKPSVGWVSLILIFTISSFILMFVLVFWKLMRYINGDSAKNKRIKSHGYGGGPNDG